MKKTYLIRHCAQTALLSSPGKWRSIGEYRATELSPATHEPRAFVRNPTPFMETVDRSFDHVTAGAIAE
jgi:hypothetical protein